MTRLLSQTDKRQRNLRMVLFIIILATLPFYCVGFVLWGTAPSNRNPQPITSPTASRTPFVEVPTATPSLEPSITPLVGGSPISPLLPTPFQFNTPFPDGGSDGFLPPTATAPPVVIPTSTLAPTLTPLPSSTPLPPPTITIPPLPPPDLGPTDTTVPIQGALPPGQIES